MRAFANLLDRLAFTPQRNGKLTLVREYLREAPDPERGFALAALTGNLSFDAAKPAMIRKAIEARMDGELFALSYDYVGDLAETIALVWPAKPGANREPELSEVVEALRSAKRADVQALLFWWLLKVGDSERMDGRILILAARFIAVRMLAIADWRSTSGTLPATTSSSTSPSRTQRSQSR